MLSVKRDPLKKNKKNVILLFYNGSLWVTFVIQWHMSQFSVGVISQEILAGTLAQCEQSHHKHGNVKIPYEYTNIYIKNLSIFFVKYRF